MDERDFAELISVFLKGSEQNRAEEQENKEDDQRQSPEAEIRKNIIEALAEKIKESQATPAPEPVEEPSVEEHHEVEEEQVEQIAHEIVEETVSNHLHIEEAREEEIIAPEEIVTEEEVETLLAANMVNEVIPVQRILHRFLDLDGIKAALLASRDGFTIDYVASMEIDLDMVSAVVATGFGQMSKIGDELQHGELNIAMMEYENGPVVIAPLTHDVYLVIVASQWATLGRIRLEIKKQAREIVDNL